MPFLSELRKNAKFCQVTKIVDKQQCTSCNSLFKIPEESEKPIKKQVVLFFFNGLEDNQFTTYLMDELRRSGKTAIFKEVNRSFLQYNQSARLDLNGNPNTKIRRAGTTETDKKPQPFHCDKCEQTFCTVLEYEEHIETVHDQHTFSCKKCNYQTQSENDLSIHFQIKHMVTKVAVGCKGELAKCDICEYKCKLTIQLRNHKKQKHPANSAQHNCQEYIKHEMESMRKEIKEAFENFADLIGEVFGNFQNKTDKNFDTLSETVLKLGERYKKLENINKLKIKKRETKELEETEKSRTNFVPSKSYSSAVRGTYIVITSADEVFAITTAEQVFYRVSSFYIKEETINIFE